MATNNAPKSLPVIRRELTLRSVTSIKTYQRTYERMEWFLYLADVLVRVRGAASRRYDQETDQVIAAIESCFDQAETALKDTKRFYENRLRNARVDLAGADLDYSHPRTLVLQTRTPLGRRYIALLELLDIVAQRVDLAWYYGLINARRQLDGNQKLYYWLLRTTRRVSILARGLATRVQDAEAAPAGIDTNYATLLQSRVGQAPTDETPLDLASEEMTPTEAAELEESKQLAAAFEVATATPEEVNSEGKSVADEADTPNDPAVEDDDETSTPGRTLGRFERLFAGDSSRS